MGRGWLLALALFLLRCSRAVRNNEPVLARLADDGGGQEDDEDEEGMSCEHAKQEEDSHWQWRYRVSNAVAKQLSATEEYTLMDMEDCSGDSLAKVTVNLKIDDTDPISKSWAAVTMEPTHVHDRLYLCPVRKNLTGGRCLAWMQPPDKSWRPHFLLLVVPFMGKSKKLMDLHLGESHAGVDVLEYVMLVVVLGFIVAACWALYVLFFRAGEIFEASEEPDDPGVGSTAESSGLAKASPIDISSPFWESVDAWVNSSLFVIAVISFLGVIMRILITVENTSSTGQPYQPMTALKTEELEAPVLLGWIQPSLITLAIAWPCTFGNVLLFRTWMSACRLQLYSAALSRGICIRGNNPLSTSALQIGGCVFLLIFCCVATAYRLWESKGNEGVNMAKKLAFLVINPMSTMLSILFFVYMRGRTHHMTQCPMAIDEMVNLMQDPDKHKGGIPQQPSVDGTSLAYSIKGGSVPVISEGAFCHICRHGLDPLKVIPESKEPLHEGQKFKVSDLTWHGRVVYQLSGFSVAMFNVPIAFFFFLILTAASVNFGIICLTMKPSLESISTSTNSLATLLPAMKTWQTDYDFVLNDIAHSFTFHVTIPPEGTNQISLRLPDGSKFRTTQHSYMATVELDGTQYPSVIYINASGIREAPSQYEISLVRIYNLVTGMKLVPFVNGEPLATRWIPWGCVENSKYSVPSNTTDVEFTFFHQAYRMGIPVNRSEGERMTSSIVTVYESIKKPTYRRCQWHCRRHARCITAESGKEGCFLIWGPSPIQESEFELPLSQAAAHLPKSNLGARLCMIPTNQLCTMLNHTSDHHLSGTISVVGKGHIGKYGDAHRRAVQLYQKFGDRQVSLELIKLTIIKGPVLPLVVLSRVSGVVARVTATVQKHEIRVNLGRYVPNSSESEFVLHLAVLLPDTSFFIHARPDSTVWNITEGLAEHQHLWEDECRRSNSKVEEYSICGGWRHSQVASCRLDLWKPELVGYLHIESPDVTHEEVEMVVTMRTEDGVEPAEMAVQKACHLDFSNLTMLEGDTLITPRVYEAAILNCSKVIVNYSGTAATGAYTWEPDIVEFTVDGIQFYREEQTILLRFFRRVEESEVISDKLEFFTNIGFRECGGHACIKGAKKDVHLNLLDIAAKANETIEGGFIAAVCNHTSTEAFSEGNMAYAALTTAVDRDKPSLVRAIATCIRQKAPLKYVPLVGNMPNSALLAMQRGNGELLNQVLRVTPCCVNIDDGSPQGLTYLEYAVSKGCTACLQVLLRRCHRHIATDRLIITPETNTERWPSDAAKTAELFNQLPRLKTLSFSYSGTEVDRIMLRLVPLAQEGSLSNVEHLSLYGLSAGEEGLSNQLAESFCELTEEMPKLRELHLGVKFSDLDSMKVFTCLSQNLPHLEVLQVQLPEADNTLWQPLVHGLRSIKSLKIVFAETVGFSHRKSMRARGKLQKDLSSGVKIKSISGMAHEGSWPTKSFKRTSCTPGKYGRGFTNLTRVLH